MTFMGDWAQRDMLNQLDSAHAFVKKGLVSPPLMELLCKQVSAVYADVDRRLVSDGSLNWEIRESMKWGGLSVRHVREEYPSAIGALMPVVQRIQSTCPGLKFVPEVSCFRRIVPATYIHWHCDLEGTGSIGHDPCWNCWIPLEDVGFGKYPSLEILEGSDVAMRQVPREHPGHRADDWVTRMCAELRPVCPKLRLGDAVLFSHWLLHRTERMSMEMLAGPRIGCELRFTAKK